MSLVTEIKNDIDKVQAQFTGDMEYAQAWLDLQRIWSKLAAVEVLESELLAIVNKKIKELEQEKGALEQVFNATTERPNSHYGNVCSNLNLLLEMIKV